jgi:coproporphyrinogen dehydrogenase HemZ
MENPQTLATRKNTIRQLISWRIFTGEAMIQLQLSEEKYEYDVRGLLMAFYPHEEIVKVSWGSGDDGSWRRQLLVEYQKDTAVITLSCREEETVLSRQAQAQMQWAAAGLSSPEGSRAKSAVKRRVYELLTGDTNRVLPWGTLTGIRPTKIAMGMVEQGMTDEEIVACMKSTYLVNDEKSALSAEIARREKALLEKLDYENGCSLYVGIPFCPTTCLYCSFTSYPIGRYEGQSDGYVAALERELTATAELLGKKKLNTVYFGGGTPTTLTPLQLERLLERIREAFDLSKLKELTVEAGRPDSITPEKLRALKKHGVSRISINPQTMKQETLDLIGRRHSVEQVREAFHMARELGFDNINMDLILGLPRETIDDVRFTMEEIKRLRPDSVTVHSLAVKRAARLNQLWEQYAHMSMENSDETMTAASSAARELGMYPYYLYRQKNMAGNLENVGFAAPGKEGLYNILIMEEKQSIVACGAGATTKMVTGDGRIRRADNVKDVALYLEKVDEMIERKRRLLTEEA